MLQHQTARRRESDQTGSEICKPPSCCLSSQQGEPLNSGGLSISASEKRAQSVWATWHRCAELPGWIQKQNLTGELTMIARGFEIFSYYQAFYANFGKLALSYKE